MKMIQKHLIGLLIFALLLVSGTSHVRAAKNKTWVRIARQGYGDVFINGYFYYYIHDNQSLEYALYRRNPTGATTCLLKYQPESRLRHGFIRTVSI